MRTCSNKMHNISEYLSWGSEQCHKISDSAYLDSTILLSHVLNKPASFCRTWPDFELSQEQKDQFTDLIQQRILPTPVAYLVGYKEFWSRKFKVTQDTLVPRPETELLIERSLELINQSQMPLSILDLGTGTGCIAITLKKEAPSCDITAIDFSKNALKIAHQNSKILDAEIKIIHSNWFDSLENTQFDLIVSNPPYIPINDSHLTQGDILAEPNQALSSGLSGLDDINKILYQALDFIKPNGLCLIEHGYDQQSSVADIFKTTGFNNVISYQDLAGRPRVTQGQKL